MSKYDDFDDFDISIKIVVHDLSPDYTEYNHEILDDKTVHAIMEQVAKAREVKTDD